MNWELVKWVAGILLTAGAIKFVFTAFRSIFSKENFEDILDAVGEKCSEGAEATGNFVKKKMAEHKVKCKIKKAEKQNKPIVYIR